MASSAADPIRIGVDLGGTKVEAVALDAVGRSLARRRVPTPRHDYTGTLDAIVALVRGLEAEVGREGTVGVGIPGAISPATGLVKNANSTWLNGKPLDRDLAGRLGRPVRLANDANCFALSEATDGVAAGAAVVFGVILGTGCGGGIAVRGRLLTGPNAIAGEWGHNPLPWAEEAERPGPPCWCGKRGCVETFVSGTGLARDFREATGSDLEAREIAARAEAGDAAAEAALARYEGRLARALAAVVNVLDPDVIVLGGGMSNLRRLYPGVTREWQRWAFSDRLDTRLVPPLHGDSSGVREPPGSGRVPRPRRGDHARVSDKRTRRDPLYGNLRRPNMKLRVAAVLSVVAAALLAAPSVRAQEKLEIFSWWAGDEGPALQALIDRYSALYPNIQVINSTVTGGSGVNARAVLKTRMLGGDPPDSFQVHAGQELIATWVVANRMDDLSGVFKSEGWMTKFPPGLISLLSTKGGIWSVPVNIHRSNVMWYVPSKLKEWGVTPPKSWDEFLTTCATLKGKGLKNPLALGENWTLVHLWESVALGVLGPEDWGALWSGKLKFTDPKAVKVWETFGKVLACSNPDASGLSWQQATDRMLKGDAAFNVMGDWAAGYMATTLKLVPGEGFGYAPSPSTSGVFMMLSDSFGLPKGAKHREAALKWLKLLGSREGQDIFNPLKGSIAARLDSDLSKYNAYLQAAAKDWKTNKIVGSLAHGAVAPEAFGSQFGTVMEIYLAGMNAKAAASAAQAIADQVRLGR